MKTQLLANEHTSQAEYLTISRAAKELGVNRNWLSAYLEGRKVRLIRIGPSLVIRRSEVEQIKLELRTEEDKTS